MRERVKVFTFVSGQGETVVGSSQEEHINEWLASIDGKVLHVSQSESERSGVGHHVTICIWYCSEED
ncbi:MAG TPA: hypothetical protein VHX65_20295 [Pirellulales bacterium]|nr:hypothetical protein [Pirellulales bacterium]